MSAFFGVSPHRTITLTFRSLATKRTRRDAQDDDDDDGAASAMVLALKIRHVSRQRHTVILPAPLAGDGTQLRGGKGHCSRSNQEEAGVGPRQLLSVAGGNAAAEPAARRHRRSRTRMQRWRFRCRSVARLAAKGHHGRCRGGGADGAEVWRSK